MYVFLFNLVLFSRHSNLATRILTTLPTLPNLPTNMSAGDHYLCAPINDIYNLPRAFTTV